MKTKSNIAIIIHGGAWSIPENIRAESIRGVEEAAKEGWKILSKKGTALDAVEKAVNIMEKNPIYDAGIGSSLNEEGTIELDAIIVDGKTLNFGSVAGVRKIVYPISLARLIMEKTNHVMLIGQGANKFAEEMGIEIVPESELLSVYAKEKWEEYKKFKGAVNNLYNVDTVGAVAIDKFGNIAAGTSTGGITGKKLGRVGDSPIIGAGAIAENSVGGVSATGHGESILKVMLARKALELLEKGYSPENAAKDCLTLMNQKVNGKGGLIVIDKQGNIGFHYTTERMAWAYMKNNILYSGI